MSARDVLGLLATAGCMSVVLACAPTQPAASLSPASEEPALFVEIEGQGGGLALEAPPQCTTRLGPQPTQLFGGQAELSLPAGIDSAALEAGQGLVRWWPRGRDCRWGVSAELALLSFNVSPTSTTPMAEWHHRMFELLRFPDERELELVAGDLEANDLTVALGFPGDPVWDDTRVYMRVLVKDTRLVALVYMTDARHWDALEPTFAASTQTLVLR